MAEKLDDYCDKHKTPMVKHREHTGNGNSRWSEPYCPLCQEQAAAAEKGTDAPEPEKPIDPGYASADNPG